MYNIMGKWRYLSMHDAMDVAEYVLDYCEHEKKNPITNLQLQKFLYYIQGANLVLNDEPIFDNDIIAWQYGPVVPDVYYSYSNYYSKKITGVFPRRVDNFNENEIAVIEKVVDILINIDIWDIVNETHKQEPWIINQGCRCKIFCGEIKNWFKNNWGQIWSVYRQTV